MEQYFNLVWKNYTASRSQNSNGNIADEDDASELFADNDLHYQVPFWIGVTVIGLLLLSAIIGIIRYCVHALCSIDTETDKAVLMPPTSPTLSSRVTNTSQRQHSKSNLHQSSSPKQFRDHSSNISVIPIKRHHAHFDTETHHYFSPNELRTSNNFRKKMHDIYVLPISPALSSSSSTTNTDDMIKTNSNTMSIQSRRYLSSTHHTHQDDTFDGVKNDCFTDSPQIKNRTLPRLQTDTLRRIPAPSQPPPLPPAHDEKSAFSINHFESDSITLRFRSVESIPTTKSHPPPVPCRAQKPSNIPIDFEQRVELSVDSSPTDDRSEHAWPNPPESMSTSQISRPASIPYDHLTSHPILHLHSTTRYFPEFQHSMLTESNT